MYITDSSKEILHDIEDMAEEKSRRTRKWIIDTENYTNNSENTLTDKIEGKHKYIEQANKNYNARDL